MVPEYYHVGLGEIDDPRTASLHTGGENGILGRHAGIYYSEMDPQNRSLSQAQQSPDSTEFQEGEVSATPALVETQAAVQPLEIHRRYTTPEEIEEFLGENPHIASFVQRLGAKVFEAESVPVKFPERVLTSEQALMRVARAETPDEIGFNGPVMAAWTPEEDRGESALNLYDEAFFARDGLRTAKQVKKLYPQLMRATLKECIKYQGTKYNDTSEEEPGKIPHEVRDPNSARARELRENNGWNFPYYGNTDNTGYFIKCLCDEIAKDPDFAYETVERVIVEDGVEKKQSVTVEEGLMAAIYEWSLPHMPIHPEDKGHAENPEGLIEYHSVHPMGTGLDNQGWRDSGEGYSDRQGRMANHKKGIADFVTNVEMYDALTSFVRLYPEKEAAITPYIENLKKQIPQQFWVEDEKGGYFALATDRDENGNIRQLDALTSNEGFILGSELIKDDLEMQMAVIRRLFSPEMINVSGIRTLSTDHPFFLPDGYHNGTVWPWYNAFIAEYLDELGYHGLATLLQERIIEADKTNKYKKFEYNRGDNAPTPSVYFKIAEIELRDGSKIKAAQPPQPYQAWTIGAVINAEEALRVKREKNLLAATDPNKQKFEIEILNAVLSTTPVEQPLAA